MSGLALMLSGLSKSFGGVTAVDDVSLEVVDQHIHGLIGPNGAGKTTLFNLISGLYMPDRGHIEFLGRDITRLPSNQVTRQGIARTFQNVRIFERMTVLENVMVGRHCRTRSGFPSAILKLPTERREERRIVEYSMECLERVGLVSRRDELAGNLPFGLMRSLEIARALASDPRLILLDEPAAGLNHTETEKLAELIAGIRESGLAVLLVEHDMRLVMEISNLITVLDQGRKIAEGTPREVQNHPKVIEAYLGLPAETGKSGKPEAGHA